jgi:hypothetical protein
MQRATAMPSTTATATTSGRRDLLFSRRHRASPPSRAASAGDATRARAASSSTTRTRMMENERARLRRRHHLRRSSSRAAAVSTEGPPSSSSTSSSSSSSSSSAPLKYEIVKGALVEWSVESPSGPHPPTAVLVHGILGSRRNLLSFAKRLAAAFPSWQFLLVDLRCHGQTAGTRDSEGPPRGDATNDVTSAAKDVLGVLNHLKMYPHALIGHSFGGKVAMSMVHQFGKQLPRPVQVWVLDTVPGDVWCEAGDHPRDTIAHARTIPMPIASRKARSYSHWSPYGPVGAVNAVS